MINIIISIIVYFFLIILQFVIPKYMPFNIWMLYPNFILMFVVYTALNKGIMKGQLTGFFYGLTWDVLSTDIFGVRTLSFTIAGYLAGSFNKKLNKNQPLTQIIVMAIGLIITHLILNVVYLILPESETVFVQSFELSYLMIFNIIV
ncbi:MAG: rod shape-determining protein MreD, partial [Elusimicrobia bacterium]|nr:rod shape-determining protein MreD [Elusimicrobiota bacterium]